MQGAFPAPFRRRCRCHFRTWGVLLVRAPHGRPVDVPNLVSQALPHGGEISGRRTKVLSAMRVNWPLGVVLQSCLRSFTEGEVLVPGNGLLIES